ncbi:hypothetical protein SAMN05421503_1432 [Terribacillus aidingensis]|uniref:Uncharacterized protein n=1 Tax=Terribacillus aidingensis TaxID=586416 RepID=A0A285NLW4_9BACI|nr:hypothetical protein [Terribacillus aidingensis]SNZ09947.1 hypothetical protein SAMN05421503_1432 [Terribacillus aidingensis]
MSKIKVARRRNTPYVVNYTADGSRRVFTWNGSKNGKIDSKDIPQEVVEWLTMNSRCFDEGELYIVEDKANADVTEIVDNILDKETYTSNTHTEEEIEAILKGNVNAMKSKLSKITVEEEKQFVIDVAQKMDLTASKAKFLAEWMEVPNGDPSLLFE